MDKIKKLNPDEVRKTRTEVVEESLTRKLNEVIDFVNNLIPVKIPNNGEKPEVVNTVGQELVEDYILYILRNHTKESHIKDSIGEAKLLGYIMYVFNQFKPVETDKEKPN